MLVVWLLFWCAGGDSDEGDDDAFLGWESVWKKEKVKKRLLIN